jgi:transcription antitermination protein NusB
MGLRRVARECALQMLYELDVGKHSKDEILRTYWQMNEHPPKVRAFAEQLFEGTVLRLKEIDKVIQQHAKNWRLVRMAVVDRNVLRLAVFEFFSGGRTPETVVINEALEIARKFSTQDSAQFVNGILDSIKNELMDKGRSSNGKPD